MVDLIYHEVHDRTPGREALLEVVTEPFAGRGDWVAVFVAVAEPWFGETPELPPAEPGEFIWVVMTDSPDRPAGMRELSIHMEFLRHPGIAGVAGRIVVAFETAAEARHLGRLLIRAAEAAVIEPEGGGS
jgi:hypothetical protein